MRIFLTGATGLIGSAVLRRLVEGGHSVTALVRSPAKADLIRSDAVTPVVGDLARPQAFIAAIAACDGVIHAGAPHDDTTLSVDEAFTLAVLAVLEGTDKPLVTTSGVWVYGDGADIDENAPYTPPSLVCWRPSLADRVRKTSGVRGIVIAPGIVHGDGRGMHTIIAGQRVDGDEPALMTVGTGRQHWVGVHADDLADLYVRALQSAPPGTTFIGAADDNPTVHELTVALSRKLGFGGRVVTETDKSALTRLGQLGEALLLDQQASGDRARKVLGWAPARPSLLQDILAGA